MITITIQIDTIKDLGLIRYQSGTVDIACFINQTDVSSILSDVRSAIKDAEVI